MISLKTLHINALAHQQLLEQGEVGTHIGGPGHVEETHHQRRVSLENPLIGFDAIPSEHQLCNIRPSF